MGTSIAPSFVLVDQDFLNLSAANLGLRLIPALGDLNADGKPDLILGRDNGQLAVTRTVHQGGELHATRGRVALLWGERRA